MKFLEIIKNNLIIDYEGCSAVNNSLLKEILGGNYKAIKSGIPKKTSIYLEFGSYVDKVIGEESLDLYIYPDFELTGQSKLLADTLILRNTNISKDNLDEIEKISSELNLWNGTKKKDIRIKQFNKPDFWAYLDRNNARMSGKDVISESHKETGDLVLNTLYTHQYSKDIMLPAKEYEVINQLAIKFRFNKVECKAKLDRVIIDHKNKTILPIDIKTGSDKDFLKNYYGYNYGKQGAFYTLSLMYLLHSYKELTGYKILPFMFLYISRSNPYTPFKFIMPEKLIELEIKGYTNINGKYIRGIIDLIEDYKWHKENNIENVPREVHMRNGTIDIVVPFYQ